MLNQRSTRKFLSTHPNNDFSYFSIHCISIMKFSLVRMAFLLIWDGWTLILSTSAVLILESIKIYLSFLSFPNTEMIMAQVHVVIILSSWTKTRILLLFIVNNMAADALALQRSRASAVMVLTQFSWNIFTPVLAPDGLMANISWKTSASICYNINP